MLLREGDARTDGIDKRMAVTLAAVAGSLNAAAFHAAGFFAANMTGNVSLLSERLATSHMGIAGFLLTVIAAFVGGAAIASVFVTAQQRQGVRGAYARCIFVEAVLLVALGGIVFVTRGSTSVSVLVLGLSFVMGLQNAVATRISNARVRTTHVSGTLTDIGIEIASLLDAKSDPGGNERGAIRSKLGLHVSTVMAFCVGGILGVIVFEEIGGGLLILAGGLLAVVAVPAARVRRSY